MIVADRTASAADVAGHYGELDPVYRAVWGDHVDHGVVPDNYFLTVNAGGGGETYGEVIRLLGAGDGMRLNIGSSSGTLYSEGSSGRIYLQGFHTSIIGSAHDDEIVDEAEGEKRIDGGDGDDVITIGEDADDSMLDGGAGADILTGGDGNDRLIGGYDEDPRVNQLIGGGGSDYIHSESTLYVIDGGNGHDFVTWIGSDSLRGGEGNDYFLHPGVGGGTFHENGGLSPFSIPAHPEEPLSLSKRRLEGPKDRDARAPASAPY